MAAHRLRRALEQIGERQLQVRETRLRGPDGALVVWQWYWIDGGFTANDYLGKVLQAKERLLRRGDDPAMVYARFDENPETARTALRSFLATELPAMERRAGGEWQALKEPRP